MKPPKFKSGNLRPAPDYGFSLIELLIVVAIILIIAAIAIPNLVRARLAANESAAVSSVRSIDTAEIAYNATYNVGYANLAQLGGTAGTCTPTAAAACLLDTVITNGTKSGYTLDAKPGGAGNTTFVATGVPITVGISGQRTFCSNQSGPIHFDAAGGAAPGDSPACDAFPLLVQ